MVPLRDIIIRHGGLRSCREGGGNSAARVRRHGGRHQAAKSRSVGARLKSSYEKRAVSIRNGPCWASGQNDGPAAYISTPRR